MRKPKFSFSLAVEPLYFLFPQDEIVIRSEPRNECISFYIKHRGLEEQNLFSISEIFHNTKIDPVFITEDEYKKF